MLRTLAHPMLLRSYGAQLGGERPHLVLEHIEGPRLSTLMRRYGMSLEQLLPLALNLCAVLHYLAHERVVHLDVKPSNIIMGGEPRLIDLSIARRLDELHELQLAGRHRPLDGARAARGRALRRDRAGLGHLGPRRHAARRHARARPARPSPTPSPPASRRARPTARRRTSWRARSSRWSTRCPRRASAASGLPHADETHIRRCTDDHRTTGRAGPRRRARDRRDRNRVRSPVERRRRRPGRAGDRAAQGRCRRRARVGDDDEGDGDATRGDDGTRGGNNTGDGDRTRGNDGTRGGNNTGDGDRTRGNDGTRGGDNTGDGDATWGNDGTGGGDNSYVAPAAGGGGDSYSGGGTDG